jgi:hypothetical protein
MTMYRVRYLPMLREPKIRLTFGFIILVFSVLLSGLSLNGGKLFVILLIDLIGWGISVGVTDKYVHKYPQRYFSYLISSHLKAAMIMAFFLLILGWIVGFSLAPPIVLWIAC